ncbi:unnamed protein product [Microthlaspi erraticum]|uniref:Uncharacterized protein n=1 Tax=Microthlaspi erraticum TaxID=1685480 RepID=A0A6D2L9H4_9BRAS|nr:unnamed protein product [Microthlaspi erraticum]
MPLLDQLSPTRQLTTLGKREGSLVLEESSHLSCAAGVQVDKRRSTPAGWMDIKFCKTNLFIEHKELDGRFQFKFTIHWLDPPSFFCPTLSSPRS